MGLPIHAGSAGLLRGVDVQWLKVFASNIDWKWVNEMYIQFQAECYGVYSKGIEMAWVYVATNVCDWFQGFGVSN